MTRLFHIAALCMAASLFNGTGAQTIPEANRYFNLKGKYSVKFPNGWKKKEHYQSIDLVAESPQEGPSDNFIENINISIEDVEEKTTLPLFFDEKVKEMFDFIDSMQILNKGETKINLLKARWVIYAYPNFRIRAKDVAYFLVSGNRGYIITCSAQAGKFEQYRKVFDEVCMSFRPDTVGYAAHLRAAQKTKTDAGIVRTEKPASAFPVSKPKALATVSAVREVSFKTKELESYKDPNVRLKLIVTSEPAKEAPYYLIEAGEQNPFNYILYWKYKVNANTGEITQYNPWDGLYIPIEEWRKVIDAKKQPVKKPVGSGQ